MTEELKNKNNTNLKIENPNSKSWANMFDEFLNTPPTASIFRLYILSFIIWNKYVILYIFFGDGDMAVRLMSEKWMYYAPFDCVHGSYIGPILVVGMFYSLVFFKFIKSNNQKFSVYNYFYKLHIESEKERLKKEEEKFKAEKETAETEIKAEKAKVEAIKAKENTNKKIESLNYSDFIKEHPEWEEDYLRFTKTSFFNNFSHIIQKFYHDYRQNPFSVSLSYINTSPYYGILNYLKDDGCFDYSNVNTRKYKIMTVGIEFSSSLLIKFNEKGKYYIQYFEWQQKIKS